MQFSPSLGETSGNFSVLIRTPARFSNYYGLCCLLPGSLPAGLPR